MRKYYDKVEVTEDEIANYRSLPLPEKRYAIKVARNGFGRSMGEFTLADLTDLFYAISDVLMEAHGGD